MTLKIANYKIALVFSILLTACSLNEDAGEKNSLEETIVGFEGTFVQEDRAGRPAVNTVFLASDRKDLFNTTKTSALGTEFKAEILTALQSLSPAFNDPEDTNALNLDAETFSSILADDVLNVSLTGPTTFFDGTNVLTGRNLTDDVIDIELLLIFGGADGSENPTLTSDNVNGNDRDFSKAFPYLPIPW